MLPTKPTMGMDPSTALDKHLDTMVDILIETAPVKDFKYGWKSEEGMTRLQSLAGNYLGMNDEEFLEELQNSYGLGWESANKVVVASTQVRNAYRRTVSRVLQRADALPYRSMQ